jgi:UPF0755 protein
LSHRKKRRSEVVRRETEALLKKEDELRSEKEQESAEAAGDKAAAADAEAPAGNADGEKSAAEKTAEESAEAAAGEAASAEGGESAPAAPSEEPAEKTNEKPAEKPAEGPASEPKAAGAGEGALPGKKPHGHRRLVLLAFILLLAAAAALGWLGFKHYIYDEPLTVSGSRPYAEITVHEGETAAQIMQSIRDAGLDASPLMLRAAARATGRKLGTIHTGLYRFKSGTTLVGILETLEKGAQADQKLRIPDGAPVWDVLKLFREAPGLKHVTDEMSEKELAQALGIAEESLEGWFAPDTYNYVSGSTDLALMKAAVAHQRDILAKAWALRGEDCVLDSPYDALILASLIEKETGRDADRALISSVFHNRLAKKMPLQTDPSVIYGIGPSFNGDLTKKDLQTPTPYNTYLIAALPPGPIAAPSRASIEAAVHPAKTDYLYFVSRGDGSSEFSETLQEHNRAVRRYILNAPKKAPAAPDAGKAGAKAAPQH